MPSKDVLPAATIDDRRNTGTRDDGPIYPLDDYALDAADVNHWRVIALELSSKPRRMR